MDICLVVSNTSLSSGFPPDAINSLQVNGGGVFDRKFTKSLIIRDFDDVLKNPLENKGSFSITHIIIRKKFRKIAMHDL